MLSRREVEQAIRGLLGKYHADYAILFGSYARESANANSDIDVVLVGGAHFRARDVFAFGEELRQLTHKDVDAFELREINRESDFYRKGCESREEIVFEDMPGFVHDVRKILEEIA